MPFWNEQRDEKTPAEKQMLEEGRIPIRFIGISAPPMRDQLQELRKRVFSGAQKVELGFWGQGKGSVNSPTPEMYGKDSREDIRALAKINDLDISTHASPNIYGWSGFDHRRGDRFSAANIEENVREVRRTIEFAQDTSNGGAVVVHTGEFQRSIAGNWGHEGFESYPGEKAKAEHFLVNKQTGALVHGISNDKKIWLPKYEEDEKGNPLTFDNMKDEFGNPIPKLKFNANKDVEVQGVTFQQYMERERKRATANGKVEPTEKELVKQFYKEQLSVQMDNVLGQAKYYGEHYFQGMNEFEQTDKNIKQLHELEAVMDPQRFKQYIRETYRADDPKEVFDALENKKRGAERMIQHGKETLTSGKRQAAQIQDEIDNAVDLEEYGVERSTATLARLGMKCMDATIEKQKEDPGFKPLFLAPENIYPEQYGAHPQELKTLILGSREKMAAQLRENGYDEEEANELAKQHIKATFDIGHVNTWWKYFNGTRDEFKEWVLTQVKDLAQNEIIGHIHIADNMGYEDDHLTPGEGTAPIKEFVDIMAKHDITDMITEPAHQDIAALFGSWKMFGGDWGISDAQFASQNGMINPQADRWTNIQNSYFGNVGAPNFIVGDYAPSQEFRGAPFYMGMPFE